MKEQELPKGYHCYTCNTWNEYPMYVFAHWRDLLVHTCQCNTQYEILMGHATEILKRKKRVSKNSTVQATRA